MLHCQRCGHYCHGRKMVVTTKECRAGRKLESFQGTFGEEWCGANRVLLAPSGAGDEEGEGAPPPAGPLVQQQVCRICLQELYCALGQAQQQEVVQAVESAEARLVAQQQALRARYTQYLEEVADYLHTMGVTVPVPCFEDYTGERVAAYLESIAVPEVPVQERTLLLSSIVHNAYLDNVHGWGIVLLDRWAVDPRKPALHARVSAGRAAPPGAQQSAHPSTPSGAHPCPIPPPPRSKSRGR